MSLTRNAGRAPRSIRSNRLACAERSAPAHSSRREQRASRRSANRCRHPRPDGMQGAPHRSGTMCRPCEPSSAVASRCTGCEDAGRRKGRPHRPPSRRDGGHDEGAVIDARLKSFAAFAACSGSSTRLKLRIANRDDGDVFGAAADRGAGYRVRFNLVAADDEGARRLLVGPRRRPGAARGRRLRECVGALGILNTAGDVSDQGPPVLRAARHERPRAASPATSPRTRMALSVGDGPRALGRDGRPGPAVRGHRRPQLSASAGRRSGRALAAA